MSEINKFARPELTITRARKEKGWLGEVVAVHTIGRFDFVEYWHEPASNSDPGQQAKLAFASYVDGKSTSNSHGSIEEAMVYAVAYLHDGGGETRGNTRAAWYFMAMIGAGDLKGPERPPRRRR